MFTQMTIKFQTLVRNAWWNPFRLWSERMIELTGAKCWWDTPAVIHPMPLIVGLLNTLLLIILPENILTQYPVFKYFTEFMCWLVPGIRTFAGNINSEPLLLLHALNWLLVPYWYWLMYRPQPILKNIREKRYIQYFREKMPQKQRTRKNAFFVILMTPLVFGVVVWAIWSGFCFEGGPPKIAKGLVYEHLITLSFWNTFLPFSIGVILSLFTCYFAILPLYLQILIFGKIE